MVHTEETKARLSKMRKGKANPFYGKKHTDATKMLMRKHTKAMNDRGKFSLKSPSIKVILNDDLYYLAGLLDGEGSIRFVKGRPFVAIYNTHKGVIDWVINTVGGCIGGIDKRGRVPAYQWKITSAADVYTLCKMLLPILKIKKEDCKVAIDFLVNKYPKIIKF